MLLHFGVDVILPTLPLSTQRNKIKLRRLRYSTLGETDIDQTAIKNDRIKCKNETLQNTAYTRHHSIIRTNRINAVVLNFSQPNSYQLN